MNSSIVVSVASKLMAVLGTYLVTKGWVDQTSFDAATNATMAIVGAIFVLLPIVESVLRNTRNAKLAAAQKVLDTDPKPSVNPSATADAAAILEAHKT